MRQYFAIILTVAVVIIILVALNAASYVRIEQTPDSEYNPDRSTYNGGATGTRALFDYLQESGRKVIRWREQPEKLLSAGSVAPGTFVVVGDTRLPFEQEEAEDLLRWVESGGRLVIIDRTPNPRLLPPAGNWRVATELQTYPQPSAQSGNADDMTAGVALARVVQPTSLTFGVDSVLPSRFAATVKVFATEIKAETGAPSHGTDEDVYDEDDYDGQYRNRRVYKILAGQPPPPAPRAGRDESEAAQAPQGSPAPVVHLVDTSGALLVDYLYGAGRVIILSDPFIVANSGINRADNLRLALNLVAGSDSLIAFDEYHQGRASAQNQIIAYFAGTPILAMLAQLALVVLVIVWTRGRRFARPVPLPFVDRRSNLEFVASMAELQQRARAYDLAIENIYARTRRVLARYGGIDSNSPRAEIANRVAARSRLDARELEALMRECEDAMAGEPISARATLNLVARLREVERTLGLRMRSRDIKQAKA